LIGERLRFCLVHLPVPILRTRIKRPAQLSNQATRNKGRFYFAVKQVVIMREQEKTEYWEPGDPLTDQDKILLEPLIRKAYALGYTPSQSDMKDINQIKQRFRTWGNAVKAADLPWVNYPDQQHQRAKSKGRPKKAGQKVDPPQ
jgi:hypothetical protein